jgi:signal transduction histidine kinase
VSGYWVAKQLRRFILGPQRSRRFDERARRLEKRLIRTEHALSLNLVERHPGGAPDLSRAMRQVVSLAFEMTQAKSCEVALYTLKTGSYHAALLIGSPADSSAQAMLGEAAGDNPIPASDQTLVQPIIFAGETLGSLRLSFDGGRPIGAEDRDVVRLLAIQAGVAILNSRHSRDLRRISQAADEALQTKLGFLANLSHEIRAPLGIMINGVELVLRGLCGDVSDDMREVLDMVKTSGSHLLELVNDVLDFAKVNAGLLERQPEVVDIDDLLVDVQKIIRPIADKKRHSLENLTSPGALSVEVDRRQIRQVLINLLTNAVKYTKDGGKITMKAATVNGIVIITVRDNGIGMKEEDLALLFDPFKRSSNRYAQRQQGTGLGMALSKQLVELNCGSISVRSTPGEGTEVSIGFSEVRQKQEENETSEADEVDGAGRRVLIVEYADSWADSVSRYLDSIGFRVAYTRLNDRSELRRLTIRGAAVVILCTSHSLDGSDVGLVRHLMDETASKGVFRPVLVVIGTQASRIELEPLLQAGVDRYIAHPASLRDIALAIDEIHRSASPAMIDRNPPTPVDIVQ